MDVLNIFVIGAILFCLFITPSIVQSVIRRNRYKKLLEEYKDNYSPAKDSQKHNNVYSFDKYKRRANKANGVENVDIIKYSSTHYLVWSESIQRYIKVPSELIHPSEPEED